MPNIFETNPKNPISEGLRLMNHCPVCKAKYSASEDNILFKKGAANLVHITCPSCQNSVMAIITVTSFGSSSVGMVTDLKAEDVLRLYGKAAISEEELLALHQELKQSNNLIF